LGVNGTKQKAQNRLICAFEKYVALLKSKLNEKVEYFTCLEYIK